MYATLLRFLILLPIFFDFFLFASDVPISPSFSINRVLPSTLTTPDEFSTQFKRWKQFLSESHTQKELRSYVHLFSEGEYLNALHILLSDMAHYYKNMSEEDKKMHETEAFLLYEDLKQKTPEELYATIDVLEDKILPHIFTYQGFHLCHFLGDISLEMGDVMRAKRYYFLGQTFSAGFLELKGQAKKDFMKKFTHMPKVQNFYCSLEEDLLKIMHRSKISLAAFKFGEPYAASKILWIGSRAYVVVQNDSGSNLRLLTLNPLAGELIHEQEIESASTQIYSKSKDGFYPFWLTYKNHKIILKTPSFIHTFDPDGFITSSQKQKENMPFQWNKKNTSPREFEPLTEFPLQWKKSILPCELSRLNVFVHLFQAKGLDDIARPIETLSSELISTQPEELQALLPLFRSGVSSSESQIRIESLRHVYRLYQEPKDGLHLVEEILKHDSLPMSRINAIHILSNMSSDVAIPILKNEIQSPYLDVKAKTIEMLRHHSVSEANLREWVQNDSQPPFSIFRGTQASYDLLASFGFFEKPRYFNHESKKAFIKALNEEVELSWSFHKSIPGKYCTLIVEPSDPDAWNDNYLCIDKNYPLRWQFGGVQPENHYCVPFNEPRDRWHAWEDNFLCSPIDFKFKWSSSGPLRNQACLQIIEPSDPNGWDNNYLCFGDKK